MRFDLLDRITIFSRGELAPPRIVSPGNRVSSRGSATATMPNVRSLPAGLIGVHQPPIFFRYGDGPETSPDGLLSAGVHRRRDGSSVAVEYADRGDGRSRRQSRRVRRASTALHRPYAELYRSCRLPHGFRPSGLTGLGSCRVRMGIARLRPRAGIALGNIRQTRTLATDPRGLRLFSG
jgi:hypothetical protein